MILYVTGYRSKRFLNGLFKIRTEIGEFISRGGVFMYAIIKTGGKQYKVSENDTIFVEKLDAEAGATVTFDEVLTVVDGDTVKIGNPKVEGASVTAEVVENGKGKKIRVFKYKAKSNYRRRMGHRQPYTKVTIKSVNM